MTRCEEIRERLPDHVLGTARSAEVEAHLAWCAGCRKEAAILAEGAAVPGLALASKPPPELEARVDRAIAEAAGRRTRRSRSGRAALAFVAAAAMTSAAVAVALAGRAERLEDQARTARQRADEAAREFEEVLEDLGGGAPVLSAPLEPVGRGQAGGRALLFDSRRGEDFAVVIAGGLPRGGEPYRALLLSPSGDRLVVGRLQPSFAGQLARYRFFPDVSGHRQLVVVDGRGGSVLEARFTLE